jgi:hypothetical protein
LFSCVLLSPNRFDYEGLEPKATYYIMRDLEALVTDKSFIGQQFAVGSHIYSIAKTDSFEYVDPVDGTVTKKQVFAGQSLKQRDQAKLVAKVYRAGEVFRAGLLRVLHFEQQSSPSRKKSSIKVTSLQAENGLEPGLLCPIFLTPGN